MRLFTCSLHRMAMSLLVIGGANGLFSCSPDYTDSQALTQLRFNGIKEASGGAFSTADSIWSQVDIFTQDEITLLISNEAVSRNVPSDGNYDVILEGYTISFERTDGGTNVPASWGTVHAQRLSVVPWKSSTTGEDVEITLYPVEQKFVRPLSDLVFFGFEQGTNFSDIRALATVKFFGKNRMGDAVNLTCKFKVLFCSLCRPA